MSDKFILVPRDELYTVKTYLKTAFFWLIWGIVKYIPSPIGDFTRYGVLKLFTQQIHSWRIKEGIWVIHPEKISIGRESGISEYCHLDGYGGITIGNFVMIGHHTTLQTTDHQIDGTSGKAIRYCGMNVGPIIIEDNVYIGAKVYICKGVKIGEGAVIGAGSIVTKDVQPNTVVVGNPAHFLRMRKK